VSPLLVPLLPASSSIHACIIGYNCLVNLYLAERVRKDPDLRCMSFRDLLGPPSEIPASIIFVLDLTEMTIPLSKTVQTLGGRFPEGKFLVMAKTVPVNEIRGLLELGIDGLMEYEDVESHLVTAIKQISAGGTWHSPTVEMHMLRVVKRFARKSSGALTFRELDIVQLVKQRLSNKEIACLLGVEEGTVKFHLGNIFSKLNIGTRDELLGKNGRDEDMLRFLSGKSRRDFAPLEADTGSDRHL
jgi:DNA-binding NarL/FixJ family response regulator